MRSGEATEVDDHEKALANHDLAAHCCLLRRAPRPPSQRRLPQPHALAYGLGQIYRRGLVRQRSHPRSSLRPLVSRGGLQSRSGLAPVALPRMGALLLHRGHGPGSARAGRRLLLLQFAAELPAAESARIALGGDAGRDADRDQPLSLLLQPAGHSGAPADHPHARGPEHRGAAAPVAPAGGRFGRRWTALHADDAHQDHRLVSLAGSGLGDAAAALA